jgi:hypothetical protein
MYHLPVLNLAFSSKGKEIVEEKHLIPIKKTGLWN